MKVLNQLIRHFWSRGALTTEQAHYLVEHGFARAEELDDYVARPAESGADDEDSVPFALADALAMDEWDEQADALAEPRPKGGKGRGRATAKPPSFDQSRLQSEVSRALAEREPYFPALIKLTARIGTCDTEEEAAVALRQAGPVPFRDILIRALKAQPSLLAELWTCVDDGPFHHLLDEQQGPVARAFGQLLRASTAEELRRVGWLMKDPGVRRVANLLHVRRLLLVSLAWMYDHRKVPLGRCVQRPVRSPPGWENLALGLVIMHNARARASGRTANGYLLPRAADDIELRDAWGVALAIDPSAATPLFASVFAGRTAGDDELPRDFRVYCPNDWKV